MDQTIDGHPQCPDVAPHAREPVIPDLLRHVIRIASHARVANQDIVRDQAEIGQLPYIVGQEDISRLNAPVEHALAMNAVQAETNIVDDAPYAI
jgi:hypothetical protein